MPPNGHALLSASSSDRWLHCPPSARLCESYADKGSDYAAEGTDAHALCEYKLRKALGMEAEDIPYIRLLNISIIGTESGDEYQPASPVTVWADRFTVARPPLEAKRTSVSCSAVT